MAPPEHPLPLAHVLPTPVMELGTAHRMLKLGTRHDLPEEGIRREQHLVIEEDAVDPDDPRLPQEDVVDVRVALMEGEPDAEVGIMVEVRPRGDDPIDEAMRDEGDQR